LTFFVFRSIVVSCWEIKNHLKKIKGDF